ncbi:MAG: helix-turn-helix domain-containing protein [Huintestinicola sp.]
MSTNNYSEAIKEELKSYGTVLTIEETASILKRSKNYCYKLVKEGKLLKMKNTRGIRILTASLVQFIASSLSAQAAA